MLQARSALTWLVRLFLAALVVQFFFAGAGAFGAESWDLHSAFGFGLVAGSLAILVVAALARQSLVLGALLFGAMLLQMVLSQLVDTSAWVASLHAVNALAVLGLAGSLAARAARSRVPAA
ncbi:MAG: hypothetical protein WD689_11255 [Gaiellaceae bacterium]